MTCVGLSCCGLVFCAGFVVRRCRGLVTCTGLSCCGLVLCAGFSYRCRGLLTCTGFSRCCCCHGLSRCVGFPGCCCHGLSWCVGFSLMGASSDSVARGAYLFLLLSVEGGFVVCLEDLPCVDVRFWRGVSRDPLPRAASCWVGLPAFPREVMGSDNLATQEEPTPGPAVENPAVGRQGRDWVDPRFFPVLPGLGGTEMVPVEGLRS